MNHFEKAHHQSVNKLLTVIRKNREPMSIKQMCETLDAASKLSFNNALNTLFERGYIKREERSNGVGRLEFFYSVFSPEIIEKYSKYEFSECEKRSLEAYATVSGLDYLKLLDVIKTCHGTPKEGSCSL